MTPALVRSAAFNAYLSMAAGDLGVEMPHLKMAAVRVSHLQDLEHGRVMALLGDVIFTKAGAHGTFEQQLMQRVWTAPEWSQALDALVDPVRSVLGRESIKRAKFELPLAVGSMARGSGGVMQLLAQLVAGSAVVGSGLGALNWHLKRDTMEDDQENELLASRANFYRDTARQIHDEMRMRNISPPSSSGSY